MSLLLTMPAVGISSQSFEKEEVDAVSPERGGRIGGVTLGFPIWRARWQLSSNLSRDMSDEWRAFFSRIRGSKRPFLAYDRDRLYPRTYPSGFFAMTRVGGSPFDGSATAWVQSVDADGEATLTLTNLPANFKLVRGDYIGFKWDAPDSASGTHDRRTMARAVAPATANATGQISVLVEPPVPSSIVPTDAIAHLDQPACVMKALPDERELAPLNRHQRISGGTLGAIQDLRR